MVPRKEIVVDESVINFKGRTFCMTYNPNKPNKWGIRIYILESQRLDISIHLFPIMGHRPQVF